MNPLSAFTFYRRHKRRATLLLSLTLLATLGVYIMAGVLDSFLDEGATITNYLIAYSVVAPANGQALDPTLVSQIKTYPDVAQTFNEKSLVLQVRTLSAGGPLRIHGVSQENMQTLLDLCQLRLQAGRLPAPRASEVALSAEIVRALGLQLGATLSRDRDPASFNDLATDMTLVGILESTATGGVPIRAGFTSLEFMESHEAYANRPMNLLVQALPERRAALETFLETTIRSETTNVETYSEIERVLQMGAAMLYTIISLVDVLVAVVIALVIGFINQLALQQRLEEFGLLQALGHTSRALTRRILAEIALLTLLGWGAGIGLALGLFVLLQTYIYYPRGIELALWNLTPLLFALPIPLTILLFTWRSARRAFKQLDPIAIIERGQLTLETQPRRSVKHSLRNPLSSWTFYLRHRQRGALLILAIAATILGIAFPVFIITPIGDAQLPLLALFQQATLITPRGGGELDPGDRANITAHPDIARVIPTRVSSLIVSIPPASGNGVNVYAVAAADLPYLLELCHTQLSAGRLPEAHSPEIILSAAIAQNRGIGLGDWVGRPVTTEAALTDSLPTQMQVVGLLADDTQWLAFMPYEYVASHELFADAPVELLVVPAPGRKAALDAWLNANIASTRAKVTDYAEELADLNDVRGSILLMFGVLEVLIALVAALALAALNYIFFSQRQDEFGILNAAGRNRAWLIGRVLRETTVVVAVAWLLGATGCFSGLLFIQEALYAPKGLLLNLWNPLPWVFTLPIPIILLIVNSGAMARMLIRLDPIAIVERR